MLYVILSIDFAVYDPSISTWDEYAIMAFINGSDI